MSANGLIALAAVVVTCATNILVAYWHRKQIRQIEEFRRDPSVGLRPPPSRFWVFVKMHRGVILGTGVPGILLCYYLGQTGPITRATVLVIAVCVASILFALVLDLVRRLLGVVEAIAELQAKHLGITVQAAATAAKVAEKTE